MKSDSAPSTRSSPKQLCAATEQRVEQKEALDDAAASAKEARERQLKTPAVNSSAPAISAMFTKKTVAESTASAKEIEVFKERECTGVRKYLADHMERANDCEIDEWYAEQDDKYEEEQERKANKCRFDEACVHLTAYIGICLRLLL